MPGDLLAGPGCDLVNDVALGRPDGRVWTTPSPAGLPGQHCEPILIGGDRLVALYVHRADPPGLRAVLSDDFGRTWRRDSEIVFFEGQEGAEAGVSSSTNEGDYWQEMMTWSFGHPRGVLLPDGSVLAVFYAGTSQYTSMR